jgi:hypothetical protein
MDGHNSGAAAAKREPLFNIHLLYGFLMRFFRKKRMQQFVAAFSPTSATTILDIGGTRYNWDTIGCPARITMLNLLPSEDSPDHPANYTYVTGDGTKLGYSDNAFDIAYSNSVIEHLHNYENQQKFAAEARRVAKKVWVQTPARCFFVEPHLIAPFVHWLPRSWQRRLLRRFTLWGLITRPTPQQVEDFLAEVRLLNYREMCELFPDCEIRRERFLGLTKSYIAVRGA